MKLHISYSCKRYANYQYTLYATGVWGICTHTGIAPFCGLLKLAGAILPVSFNSRKKLSKINRNC